MGKYQCHFIIPDPGLFPSGGNVYNASLMARLIKLGVHVSHSPFRPHVSFASPHTRYVLDSIYFGDITNPELQIPEDCIGLVHHLGSLYPQSDAVFENSERQVLSRFSDLLVTSNFTKQYLVDRGFEDSTISVIEPAPSMQPVTRVGTEKVRALMVGSCFPRKGQLEFLEALAGSDVDPYFRLIIAGSLDVDTQYARQCQEIVLGTPVLASCVRFVGEQDESAITRLYAESNLFISSSGMETFGMAIQDAIVSGLPVLSRAGGYAGVHVDQRINGFKCRDVSALVQEFVRCTVDRDHFIKLQERAAAHRPSYTTWDAAAERFSSRFLN